MMNSKNKKLKIAIAGLGFGKKVHLAVSYTHLTLPTSSQV